MTSAMPQESRPPSAEPRPNGGRHWRMAQAFVLTAVTFLLAVAAVLAEAKSVSSLASERMAIWGFLAAFAAATALLLILTRSTRTRLLDAVFQVAIFSGVWSVLFALTGPAGSVAGTAAAVFLYYGSRSALAFDLLLAVGSAGIAAKIGGTMQPTAAAVILAALAVYDVVAAYVTGHTAEVSEALLRRRAFFAMMLSDRPGDLLLPVRAVSRDATFAYMAVGDVILPAILVASVAASGGGAALVAAGAIAGLACLHGLFRRGIMRGRMPDLPPIAAGTLAGYLLSLMLS